MRENCSKIEKRREKFKADINSFGVESVNRFQLFIGGNVFRSGVY